MISVSGLTIFDFVFSKLGSGCYTFVKAITSNFGIPISNPVIGNFLGSLVYLYLYLSEQNGVSEQTSMVFGTTGSCHIILESIL